MTNKFRDIYLKKYPSAIITTDSSFYSLDEVKTIDFDEDGKNFKTVDLIDYMEAKADPILPFSRSICKHLNEEHKADLELLIKAYTVVNGTDVKVITVDSLGMTVIYYMYICL
jgi:hypothetical protein